MRTLPSANGQANLLGDILSLSAVVSSGDFDIDHLTPLLKAVLNKEPDDLTWDKIYSTVIESTPPPKPLPFLDQRPYSHTTSSFANSSEHRKYADAVLKEELGSIYVGVPGFFEAFFGDIDGLETAGAAVFEKCKEGDSPLFNEMNRWRDWPECAGEKDVLTWLSSRVRLFCDFSAVAGSADRRTILAQPNHPLQGSTADQKLDLGIVCNSETAKSSGSHWSHVLVIGELKSNPSADTASKTWRDLGRYAREVFTIQDTRQFALGFTLCGSTMRLWEFDRTGAIASPAFDINKDGLRFVSTMLGLPLMEDNHLGYDPTILCMQDGKRFIEVVRSGQSERLILDGLMKRAPCVAGRVTTCWKAHCEGDEANTRLVIKNSWQYQEREEEGEILREVTGKGVANFARYHHHETACVGEKLDDTSNNVRKGLDVTKASNYRTTRFETSTRKTSIASMARVGRSSSSTGRKRSLSPTTATMPPNKRFSSPSRSERSSPKNRIHRRVIIRDYGVAIYKAKSRVSMISALKTCIKGYESLHTKAGIFQSDISTGNLVINEEEENLSWPAFLIDLDLAIEAHRERPSGAQGKTGTRAFMAVGLLLGEKHSFRHDLESFFWVLFWICIHYDGPGKALGPTDFDRWNYEDDRTLARSKQGMVVVADEADFLKTAGETFTPCYQSLVPWANRLRRIIFPGGLRRKSENRGLYGEVKAVLDRAIHDPSVSRIE